ncbi:MAG: TonB-dependent receptor, partial [Leptospiraceae bacterium]|nr:TonB-dependent receptor [Leptospiraceae bacterium]
MNKLLLVLISLLFVFTELNAQQKTGIKGVVLDENGEAIYSANVVVDASKGWAAATDFDGKFYIELPEGKYVVLVRYIGYENKQLEINLKAGELKDLIFNMESSDQLVGEVEVVSATKRGIVAEKEVVTVETVSAELLSNNNITIASDAVDKVTGVTLLDGQVSIRGGSGYAYGTGSRVILVIDEIPLLSPERNEVLWDFIPMENVKSIDVVKGASSVQYGSAALNGIISVNTKWPTKKKETDISLFGSIYSNPPIDEGRWWTYSTQNFRQDPHEMGIQAAHRRKLTDNLDLVLSGALISNQSHIQNQFNHRFRNNIKLRYTPAKIKGLSLVLNSNLLYRNNDQFFIWDNDNTGAYQGQSYEDRYIRYSIDPIIKFFYKENNQFSLINRFYYDERLNKGEKKEYSGLKVYNDFQYKRTYKVPSKKINGTSTFGFVNTHDIIEASSFKEYSSDGSGIFHFNTASVYTQSDFGWNDLTLALGARFDYVALDGLKKASKPVFNAGTSYEIGTNNFVRFGFGQSFRIPSVAERFVKEKITSVRLVGPDEIAIYAGPNPDIRPESGYSFELGYKKVIKTPKFNANFDAVIFYQKFTDMTEFTFGSYIDPADSSSYTGFSNLNVAQARIFGWEGALGASNTLKKSILTYSVGYTYSYAANAEEDPELSGFLPVVKNAFKAFKISDEEYRAFNENGEENILYGMLRYRFRHTVKLDFNVDLEKFSFGTNIRYYSFMDRVDAIFALFIPGIQDYRDSKNNKGDWVVDLR